MAYGKASRESVESAQVGGGTDFWQTPDGESRIRVMPPWSEDNSEFWFVTGTHFNVGPDERAVPCPAASGVRESCFICRLVKRLSRGDDNEKQESESMGARPRYLLNIVDLDKPQDGVQVWPAPKTIFRQLKKFWLNEDDYGDFTSLEDGFDIIVERTGSSINTKYDATPARKNTRFPDDKLLNHRNAAVAELYQALAAEELELPDLSKVQVFVSDEEMERVYKGLSSGRPRTETEEEPEEPAEKEQPRARRNGRDEEPEERPRRSRREREEEPEEPTKGRAEREEEPEEPEEPEERTRKPRPSARDEEPETPRARVRGRVKDLD